jgi:hypothetical protein
VGFGVLDHLLDLGVAEAGGGLDLDGLRLAGVSAAQLAITLRTRPMPNMTCPPVIVPRSLPCQAIPLRYVEDEPVCADKLLHAMNITNSHILTWDQMLREINASGVYRINRSQR